MRSSFSILSSKTHLPDLAPAYLLRGSAYLMMRRVEEASSDFEAVLKAEPQNPPALFNLGRIRLEQGRAEEAQDLFPRVARNQLQGCGGPPSPGRGLSHRR